MKARILKHEEELVRFKERFEERGNPVHLSYLDQAEVRGFFNAEGEMIAGYALNHQRLLRYEMWVPELHRSTIPILASNLRVCELSSNWISEKPGSFSSERIYLQAIVDTLASGAQFVVAGTLIPKVFGIHTQIFPQILYIGETTYFGKPETCWIYGASRSVLLWKLMSTFPLEIIGRLLGRQSYRDRARAIAETADSHKRLSEFGPRFTGAVD